MKKVIAGLLSVAMIAAMAGCNKTPAQSTTGTTKAGESKPAETTAPAEIEKRVRIVDGVIRYLLVKQDEA